MITKYLLLLAIIGAGIGGTSSAHFLRKKFGPSCNITIYESGHIGGRLATTVMAAVVRGLQGGEEALEVVGEGDLRPPESS